MCMGGEIMSLENVLAYIQQADDDEINQIIDALTARYSRVYPDREVAFLSLPRNDRERRRRILEFVLKYDKPLP